MQNSKISSVLYLSQKDGNDFYAGFAPTPDGKGNGPLKTIAQLESTIYSMRGSGNMRPITVRVLGDLCLDKTLELGARFGAHHHGLEFTVSDITFESYGEQRARIIGG